MWRPNMFSRVNNTSQNIITTATTQEYGRIYLYMYTAAITGHHTLDIKSIDINSTMKRQIKLFSLWNKIQNTAW